MPVPGANTGILVSRRNRSSETEHECRVPRAREREAVGKPASRKVCRRRKSTSGTQIFHSVSAAAIRDDTSVGRRRCARRFRPVRRCGGRALITPRTTRLLPRSGACSAGQRPVPDVIRRAIERDGSSVLQRQPMGGPKTDQQHDGTFPRKRRPPARSNARQASSRPAGIVPPVSPSTAPAAKRAGRPLGESVRSSPRSPPRRQVAIPAVTRRGPSPWRAPSGRYVPLRLQSRATAWCRCRRR